MLITLLTLIDLVLYLLFALSVGYLLVFTLASKFSAVSRFGHSTRRPAPTSEYKYFCVLFPAYKEDKVILQAAHSFLRQDYPQTCYDLVIISDQMQPATNAELQALPLQLLIATYEQSSKAKALSLAVDATANVPYDAYIIMDADNTTSPDFLCEMNRAFNTGLQAVQAHRIAKNMNTDIALLDAVSEEINNSIFRSGHVVLGLPSALIGSGMGIEAKWFRNHVKLLQTAGEDKELEAMLLKERIHIAYLEHIKVEDEKTQKEEVIQHQRKRWLAAQFGSLWAALPDLPGTLLQGNIGYLDKIIQWALPPRIVLLAGIFFFSTLVTLINPAMSLKWWVLSVLLIVTLIAAIPRSLMNKRLLKAIFQVPSLALMMIGNLFKLRGINKKFIHTEHGEHP